MHSRLEIAHKFYAHGEWKVLSEIKPQHLFKTGDRRIAVWDGESFFAIGAGEADGTYRLQYAGGGDVVCYLKRIEKGAIPPVLNWRRPSNQNFKVKLNGYLSSVGKIVYSEPAASLESIDVLAREKEIGDDYYNRNFLDRMREKEAL